MPRGHSYADENDEADAEKARAEEEREKLEEELRDLGIDPDDEAYEAPDYEDWGRNPDGSTDDEPGDGYV